MVKSSKYKGLEKYTVGDLFDEKKRKEIEKRYPTILKDMKKNADYIGKHEAKKGAQPFKTNYLLKDLLNSQTPKWVNYTILLFAFLAFLIGVFTLLHSYKLI